MSGDRYAAFRPIHVDDRIVVIDKRAGVLVHRTPTSEEPTLIDDLYAAYGFVHPIHRLDRFVSGLLVYARDEEGAAYLKTQFAEHTAERRYLAAVEGRLSESEGSFRSRLLMERGTYRMRSAKRGVTKRAVTHWWTVEDWPAATLVEVALETGVKNQIRVHFAEAGHPILGEQKYLPEDREGARTTQRRRLFLHAAHLAVRHPSDGQEYEFEAPLPADLTRWKGRLRHARTVEEATAAPGRARPRGRRARR